MNYPYPLRKGVTIVFASNRRICVSILKLQKSIPTIREFLSSVSTWFSTVTRRVKKDMERFSAVTGKGEKGRGSLPSLGSDPIIPLQKNENKEERHPSQPIQTADLTIRFLESCTSTATTKLLGLAASWIGDKERTVVPDEDVLYLLFGVLVNILLVVSNESLGDALADGVYLRGLTTSSDADPHVDSPKSFNPGEQDWFKGFVAEDLRLHELDRDAVNLDQTLACLAVGHSNSRLFAAEALNRIYSPFGSHRRLRPPPQEEETERIKP
ncbi:hypothetical protein M5K25_027697 [Dendrobium thyrsiflorum]|uniref:Uncharacterized protein n=1 Tax=Dendrobium thyrsiflorum TaxID=117978 RepID=A0ABD0TUJ2_DENTH